MQQEIWKDVPGYEGYYQASNLGRIKSLSRIIKHSSGGFKKTNEFIMKLNHQKANGYVNIQLSKNGKIKGYRVHRLVAITFLPNKENKKYINHLNGVKHDNALNNLEWCTASENMIHASNNNLLHPYLTGKKGHLHHCSRKINQLDMNGNFIKTHKSIIEAANSLGVNNTGITKVASGVREHCGGYKWKYAD